MYRRAGRGRLFLLAFLALSIVVITLDFRQSPDGPLERAKDISSAIVAPIQRGIATVFRPIGNLFSSIGDLTNLRSENQDLSRQVDELEKEVTEAQSLEDDYRRLQQFFDLDEPWTQMETATASVIGRAPSNYKWAWIVDRGREDGIRPDMSVITPEGLVGKVIRVSSDTATIIGIIDPQGAARARIAVKGFTGVVRGNGADQPLTLEFIEPAADVTIGDDVVTSGYDEGIFPPSIPIGEVVDVEGREAALDQEIAVEPWVDFTKLNFVQVLLESGPVLTEDGKRRGR
jgi:rod shape-determining protein MreC